MRPVEMEVERSLRAVADLATSALVGWAAYIATEAALSSPIFAASGGDGTPRGKGHPDPTGTIALSHMHYWSTVDDVHNALLYLRSMQRRMNQVRRHHPEVARRVDAAVKAIRCDGSIDATCVRNAVRDGLCWACYQRRRTERATRTG